MPTYLYCYLRMRNKGCDVRTAFTKNSEIEKGTRLQTKSYVRIAFLSPFVAHLDKSKSIKR